MSKLYEPIFLSDLFKDSANQSWIAFMDHHISKFGYGCDRSILFQGTTHELLKQYIYDCSCYRKIRNDHIDYCNIYIVG